MSTQEADGVYHADPSEPQPELSAISSSPDHIGIVFPGSNRVRVNPTTTYPQNTIGWVVSKFPNGNTYGGTGVLIDRYVVLTAAHNLYGNDKGGWATSIIFIPARNDTVSPYGNVAGENWIVPNAYRELSPPSPDETGDGDVKDYTQYLYDYGLIKLKEPVDNGRMRMHKVTNDEIKAQIFNVTGYPGDKTQGTMWEATGNASGYSEEFLFYKISTYKGVSGAAVYTLFPGQENPGTPRTCGVHVAGSTQLGTNFAVRLTKEVIEKIEAMKKQLEG